MQDTHMPFAIETPITELLHRAAARIDAQIDQRIAKAGLTSRQHVLLRSIAANPGINQMGLSALTGIDRSTMTEMVGRLVSRGLVVREKKATDARAYEVHLTDVGGEKLALAEPEAASVNDALSKLIEPALHDVFAATLKRIADMAA